MSLGDARMRRVDSQLINMPDNVAMRHRTESVLAMEDQLNKVIDDLCLG